MLIAVPLIDVPPSSPTRALAARSQQHQVGVGHACMQQGDPLQRVGDACDRVPPCSGWAVPGQGGILRTAVPEVVCTSEQLHFKHRHAGRSLSSKPERQGSRLGRGYLDGDLAFSRTTSGAVQGRSSSPLITITT